MLATDSCLSARALRILWPIYNLHTFKHMYLCMYVCIFIWPSYCFVKLYNCITHILIAQQRPHSKKSIG